MTQPPQRRKRWGNNGGDDDLWNQAPGNMPVGDGGNIDLHLQTGLQAGLPVGAEDLWQRARGQGGRGPPTGSDRQTTPKTNPTPRSRPEVMEGRLPGVVDSTGKVATNGPGEGGPTPGAPHRPEASGARQPPAGNHVANHGLREGPTVDDHGVDGCGTLWKLERQRRRTGTGNNLADQDRRLRFHLRLAMVVPGA